MHPTVTTIWNDFSKNNRAYQEKDAPAAWYFCDNKKDADICAELVMKGIKKATSPSLWSFEKNNEPLPKIGDINIITNWEGEAKAIIQTTKIEQVPYNEISAEYAAMEGEGDKSLDYWRQVHWDYYTREMLAHGTVPKEDMLIVCEHFKVIWTY